MPHISPQTYESNATQGYGTIVLRRQRDALLDGDRIVCSIRNAVAGSAGAVEGISEGAGRMYESPCVWGMKQLMQRAWEGAALDPALLSYMECHGACVINPISTQIYDVSNLTNPTPP